MTELSRVIAPNPGPMTERGTNTWLLGTREVAVIDPGPDEPAHLDAILAALAPGARVTAILVTHAHRDHSALAPALAARTGAPVLAHGPAEVAAAPAGLGGGEGVDHGFAPDRRLAGGDTVSGEGWRLVALHTPGHMPDHLAFVWEAGGAVFTGDHVMGWATTFVSPPEGDMAAYMAALDRLEARPERRYLPGHGAAVEDGPARVRALRAHRLAREGAILDALRAGPADLATLTARVYADTPPALHGAAARNLLAHLGKLAAEGRVAAPGGDPLRGRWAPRG